MVKEDAPVTTSSAKAAFYPKGDENIKKVGKSLQVIPGNEITGASMGNKMTGKQNSKTRAVKKAPELKMAKLPEI